MIEHSIDSLVDIIGQASVEGNTGLSVSGVATLKEAQAGDLSFLGNKKYKTEVPECQASVILLPNDYSGSPKMDRFTLE